MSRIYPFRGVLPTAEKVAEVAAVPYDVVNTEEAASLARGKPLSFLRVSRPEIEFSHPIDLYDDQVYAKGAENYIRLKKQAPLLQDDISRLYVYTLTMGDHKQTGVVAAASVDDYDREIIKKHEKTRKDKEDDRTRQVMTLRSHTGPVFLTYRDVAAIDAEIQAVVTETPRFDFVAPDGVRHQLWAISAERSQAIAALFLERVPRMYVADGHHRAASASRVRAELKKNNLKHTGDEEYNRFLAVIFPSSQLRIMPYNRCVRDLNGLSESEFLKAVGERFEITPGASATPTCPGDIRVYFNGRWMALRFKGDLSRVNVTDRLDVSVLQNHLLAPVLGIDDPRTSKRIDFIGGIRGVVELEKMVNSGKGVVAFSMYPTTLNQLMEISDNDQIMPPKSTWFEPKLRDGLVCHDF